MSFHAKIFVGLMVLCFWLAPEASANFAPFAAISVNQTEALQLAELNFSSEGSVDPDAQPQPLSFSWDFGDGTFSTEPNPQHAFARSGAYEVSLTVSDGADQSVASLSVVVLDPPTSNAPSKSSPICFNGDQSELWVVNQDNNSLTVFSVSEGRLAKITELATGKSPRTIAFDPLRGRMLVACQDSNQLWVFDAVGRKLERKVRVGHLPYGVCVTPHFGKVVVTNQGDQSVHILNSDLNVEAIVSVAANPRAVAITADGAKAFVTHFITSGAEGTVTQIDLDSNLKAGETSLIEDQGPDTPSSSKGFPNLLSALCIEPAGKGLWVGGYKSNSGRGMFRTGSNLTPPNTVRGFLGRIDLLTNDEDTDRRIDPNNADSISSIAFSPNGRWAYVTHQGAETVSIYDIPRSSLIKPGDGNSVPFISRIDVGSAPQGLLVSRNGQFLYVLNYLSRNVMVVDVSNPAFPKAIQNISTAAESLPDSVANGKRMFYSSKAPRHSKDNYIACASCHGDGGGHDGRTWDFTGKGEGFRNTSDLRGKSGMAQGPVHWSGNFDEIQDFENDIVNAFGGTGLANDGKGPNLPMGVKNAGRSKDLDDLAAYVSSLDKAPASPFRKSDGALSDLALRGKGVFFRNDSGCVKCHSGPSFTDSTLGQASTDFVFHDIGTIQPSTGTRLGESLSGIDTPTLLGLWASSPYLHDGRANTLLELFTTRNSNDTHGRTSILNMSELNELVAFLQSLDEPGKADQTTDEDADGMSDTWELANGLKPNDPNDGKEDADKDGVTNAEEFAAGTDPTESSSLLRLLPGGKSSTSRQFSFQTTRGIRYQLERESRLPGKDWMIETSFTGDGLLQFGGEAMLNTNRFYRLKIIPNP